MRLLHLTDTHLGAVRWVPGAPSGFRRADDHFAAFERALAPAFRGEVDAVVHSGDLFNRSRPPAAEVVRAAELLCAVARVVPLVVLPGNHDRRGLQRYLPHRLPRLHVHDEPAVVNLGAVRLALLPFRRTADRWAHEAAALAQRGADLFVTHMAFDGVQVPGLTFRASARADTVGAHHIPPGIRWVLCGHIHPRQVITVGDARVVHPGSTERTSFSERDEVKGFAMWHLGREVRARFVDLPTRPMVLVRHPGDLSRVRHGTLVRVAGHDPELTAAVTDRGGWIDDRPATEARRAAPEPQALRLF